MNEYCAVFGCRGLAAAMRSHIEPSWSDGLFAAGALRVGDHMLLTFPGLIISAIILRTLRRRAGRRGSQPRRPSTPVGAYRSRAPIPPAGAMRSLTRTTGARIGSRRTAAPDVTLTVLGELRPVRGDPFVVVELPAVGQHMGASGHDALGRAPAHGKRVACPGNPIQAANPTPQIDDKPAAVVDGHGGAAVGARRSAS